MPPTRKNRSTPLLRRWKVALANAGMHQAEWAKQFGWTDSHVSQVVSGKRESVHVVEQVTSFIETQEQLIAARVAKPKSASAA